MLADFREVSCFIIGLIYHASDTASALPGLGAARSIPTTHRKFQPAVERQRPRSKTRARGCDPEIPLRAAAAEGYKPKGYVSGTPRRACSGPSGVTARVSSNH